MLRAFARMSDASQRVVPTLVRSQRAAINRLILNYCHYRATVGRIVVECTLSMGTCKGPEWALLPRERRVEASKKGYAFDPRAASTALSPAMTASGAPSPPACRLSIRGFLHIWPVSIRGREPSRLSRLSRLGSGSHAPAPPPPPLRAPPPARPLPRPPHPLCDR